MDVGHARARLIVKALPEPGETVRVRGKELAHVRARRLALGDFVVLLDGSGREAIADVVALSRTEAVLRVSEVTRRESSARASSLYVAGLKPERLAWAVEKATELGASRVVIVESERTQSFRAAASLLPRLLRVARESAKQCERAEWPAISGPMDIQRVLEDERSEHRLFLDFDGDRFPRRLSDAPSALLVGPEGGWTGGERREASDRGWRIVSLPAGRLRAETAAVAGLTLLRAAFESGKRET